MKPGITARLDAATLKALAARSDKRGALRAVNHLGAIMLAGTALLMSPEPLLRLPLTLLLGYLLAFLFTAEHEAAHQTVFRRRGLNLTLGHLAGFVILLPYEYYRAYHWDHHRHTQDPRRDPELAVSLPTSWPALLWLWSGVPTWISRLRMLLMHAAGGVPEPWIARDKQALITREARAYLLGYAGLASASILAGSLILFWLWLLPLMAGYLFLRPYLLAEHTGCEHSRDTLSNTRTTHTNAFVRFFSWNMPFHVEHHAYPAVPFHALPRLHEHLAGQHLHLAAGYRAATQQVIDHLLHPPAQQKSPTHQS